MTASWLTRATRLFSPLLLLAVSCGAEGGARTSEIQAEHTLHRAAAFFRERLAVQGSFVWRYSEDLSERRGEAITTPAQGWVQPPGTPAVGMAFLQAYNATRDAYFLEGAIEAARALANTQLQSGGWAALIEFDPSERRAWCYRVDGGCDDNELSRRNKDRDATLIDDDISQSALRLLMLVDCLLDQEDTAIHEAVTYGLAKFIEAQYANGAWPFRFDRALPPAAAAPNLRATYTDDWPRNYVEITDPLFYPVNDNVLRDLIRTFLLAHHLYARNEYLDAARRAGDFLLAAQLPAPQRGWAQTYNRNMRPIWGRKFEPPSVASNETKGAVEALLELYGATGDVRYRDAASEAVAWLKAVRLPGGEWARFYELGTDRPLYMTKDYALTYQDDDLPSHYGFEGLFGIPLVIQLYGAVLKNGVGPMIKRSIAVRGGAESRQLESCLAPAVAEMSSALDPMGRWVERGLIRSSTFVERVTILAEYLRTARNAPPLATSVALPIATAIARTSLVQSKC